MLEGSKAEKEAKERGDWKSASQEFKKLQEQFHRTSNSAKNASLYVDWKDGEFTSPTDQIDREMLNEIIVRNEKFLGHAHHSLGMLQRLEKAPHDMQAKLVEFTDTIEKMRAEDPGAAMAAIDAIINKFLEGEHNKKQD